MPPRKSKKTPAAPSELSPAEISKRVDLIMDDFNKALKGRGRLCRADEYVLPHLMLRYPSGFPSLDKATAGGLPAGSFIEFAGSEGTGKTELATLYMAMQQVINDAQVALAAIMTELHFDKLYAKKRGLRISLDDREIEAMERAEGAPFDDGEIAYFKDSVGEFIEGWSATAEDTWESILRLLGARIFHIILIDSLGALMPKAEADEDLHQKHYGGSANVNTAAFHKFHALMGLEEDGLPNKTLVIGINQVRDKLNAGMYDKIPKIGGGHAKDHGKAACIYLEQGARIRDKKVAGSPQIGKVIRWHILKGKLGFPEGATGELTYLYKFGFDRAHDILDEAVIHGFVSKAGAYFKAARTIAAPDSPDVVLASEGETLGQGTEAACTLLRSNTPLMDALYDLIMRDAGIRVNYK